MWTLASLCPHLPLFGSSRTGLTDDRGKRWSLHPDYKTQHVLFLQNTRQRLQVDIDTHTHMHTRTFIASPKYIQNVQRTNCLTVLQCTTWLFHVCTSLMFGDYFDLLQSVQSNQADPEPCSRTGSSTAWISHLSEDLVYQQTGLGHPLLLSLNTTYRACHAADSAWEDTNCFWAEKRDWPSRMRGLFALNSVKIRCGFVFFLPWLHRIYWNISWSIIHMVLHLTGIKPWWNGRLAICICARKVRADLKVASV